MNSIKNLILFAGIIVTGLSGIRAQDSITIEECNILTRRNYPAIKQMALIEKSQEYSLSNAAKGYLPQVFINGQATYQSDVTSINIPNMNTPTISKDQYKLFADINQPLTDVFVIQQQKEIIKANSDVEKQKLEVELYKLKERVNQIYFGILLIDSYLEQTSLVKKELETSLDKVNAAIANGLALKINADLIKAELLKLSQRIAELKANRKGFVDMLVLYCNRPMDDKTYFQPPLSELPNSEIKRPELQLFAMQRMAVDQQIKLLDTKKIPRLSFFLQTGFGRPALNFLKNDFTFYYIGGLRLTWNLSNFYSLKKDKELMSVNQNMIGIQQDIFLFNTQLLLSQQDTELAKYQELIASDSEIILLREKIRTTASKQLENGTLNANDYLSYVYAEDTAKQNLLLHQLQLLMTQYNYQIISGN